MEEKTKKDLKDHHNRLMLINNKLGEEYRDWFGWPEHSSFGRYLALGEYLVELCEFHPHDEWFDIAKDAYLKWKKAHHFETIPPK